MTEKSIPTNNNGSYKRVIISTLITVAISFAAYLLLYNVIIMALFMDVREEDRNWTRLAYAVIVLFALVFHFVYARSHIDSNGIGIVGGGFDVKEAVTEFYLADGKAFMIVYGVLAVLYEVFYIIAALSGKMNIVLLALSFLFPAADIIPIPVLRTVVAYTVTVISIFAVVALRKYKIQKYWEKGI